MAADLNNEKLISRYLLGELSEEQQVEIEDRAFADKEYLASITAVENDLIDEYVRSGIPTVEPIVMGVVKDSTLCSAFESDEAEPAVDEAGKRPHRVTSCFIEQEFIFAWEKSIGLGEHFLPLPKILFGDRFVGIDRNEGIENREIREIREREYEFS